MPRAGEHRIPNPEVGVDTAQSTFNRHGQVYEDNNYEIGEPRIRNLAMDHSQDRLLFILCDRPQRHGSKLEFGTRRQKLYRFEIYTSGYIRTSPLVEEVPPVGTDTEQPIPNNLVGSRARYQ